MALPTQLTIGTRKSKLAVTQAEMIGKLFQENLPGLDVKIHAVSVTGDHNPDTPLPELGSKDLWTYELEALLLDKKLDLVVNCLKDMPAAIAERCSIGAIVTREDPRDALIVSKKKLPHGTTLETLPSGSVVGTSSRRRSAQLALRHPHLQFVSIRGNIDTRLAKLDADDSLYSCIVLAAAGLNRMGLQGRISQLLDWDNGGIMYAVGQGARALEIREGDDELLKIVEGLAEKGVSNACLAERSLLRTLEGGCSVPIGVETMWEENSRKSGKFEEVIGGRGLLKESTAEPKLKMRAIVVSLDGKQSVTAESTAVVRTRNEAESLGKTVAAKLTDLGARKILDEIKSQK